MRERLREEVSLDLKEVTVSLSRTVFGSEFQMAGAMQRNERFAIVILVNGRHSADCGRPLCPGVGDGGRTASTCCEP